MRLKNKIGVVTGSSRGIGRAIAERLAEDGALVAVHYATNAEAAAATVRQIEANGGAAFAVQADLARTEQIQQLFETLDAELTRRTGEAHFDILVNNAGVNSPASYRQMTVEQLDHLFAVNVRGAFFVTQAAVPRLRDGGRIINISSTASRHAAPIADDRGLQHDEGGPGLLHARAGAGSGPAPDHRQHHCSRSGRNRHEQRAHAEAGGAEHDRPGGRSGTDRTGDRHRECGCLSGVG
jgi:NAD(P)-dependent dehydrogenase (short-subunit alcohol dehydrogenase family)